MPDPGSATPFSAAAGSPVASVGPADRHRWPARLWHDQRGALLTAAQRSGHLDNQSYQLAGFDLMMRHIAADDACDSRSRGSEEDARSVQCEFLHQTEAGRAKAQPLGPLANQDQICRGHIRLLSV
jgi:hypothetical protein